MAIHPLGVLPALEAVKSPQVLPASVPMLGIVGWSGSGKTTLLEFLLPRLAAQGLRVGVIKHSHHAAGAEDRHKDSFRLRASGATQVLLANSCGGATPPLIELAATLKSCDLVLVEGFKREPIPKLEIYRDSVPGAPLYPHDHNVIAVATDGAVSGLPGARLIWLDLRQPAQVLAWMQIRLASLEARAHPS